jgi:hypothetical protein
MMSLITEKGGRDQEQSIEIFCQIAAGLMLLPLRGLRAILGPAGTVDSIEALLRITRGFRVSPEVAIHRIDTSAESEGLLAPHFDLFMVRRTLGKEQVRAILHSPTLKDILARPKLYAGIHSWIKKTPVLKGCPIFNALEGQWQKRLRNGTLGVVKRQYDSESYFLEMKYTPS